jgi:hypothetical protein
MAETYPQTAILKTVGKNKQGYKGRESPSGLTPLFAKI